MIDSDSDDDDDDEITVEGKLPVLPPPPQARRGMMIEPHTLSPRAYSQSLSDEPGIYTLAVSNLKALDAERPAASSEEADSTSETYPFFTGNPSIRKFKGSVRVFKNNSDGALSPNRTKRVCVLAVPSYMSITDFFQFLGAHVDHVKQMRIVHVDSPDRYMVLLDFQTQESTDALYISCNGRPYSSMDTERCIILFIDQIHFTDTDPHNPCLSMWANPDSTAALTAAPTSAAADEDSAIAAAAAALLGDEPTTPAGAAVRPVGGDCVSEPGPGESAVSTPMLGCAHTELPSCPVCLERLDVGVTGIMTTLCNHSFHCRCLSEWQDSSCPVCRYSQQPQADATCYRCSLIGVAGT